MPAHPATAGRKAGTVRVFRGAAKNVFPAGHQKMARASTVIRGTGRLFQAVFRKNVIAGAPFFIMPRFAAR